MASTFSGSGLTAGESLEGFGLPDAEMFKSPAYLLHKFLKIEPTEGCRPSNSE